MKSTTDATVSEIAAIWTDLLQLERAPAPADNFFSLGGDSLLMAMVLFRVNQAFGIELPPVALLETPDLGAFGAVVESYRIAAGQDAVSNAL